jgi:hypothetical protein
MKDSELNCGRHAQNKIYSKLVGFEVLTAVVMNVAIFWDVVLFSLNCNLHFGGMYHYHIQG